MRSFYLSYSGQLGLVGLQEDTFPSFNGYPCLPPAGIAFKWGLVSAFNKNSLTVAASEPWQIIDRNWWRIGRDAFKYRKAGIFGGYRYMVMMKVRPRSGDRTVPFYTVHLSHKPDQRRERNAEVRAIVDLVLKYQQRGETLPIVVGDFNFSTEDEPENAAVMGGVFEQVAGGTKSIDQIWIGRPEAFPNNGGSFTASNELATDLGVEFDHDSPQVILSLTRRDPPPLPPPSPPPECGGQHCCEHNDRGACIRCAKNAQSCQKPD